MSHGLLEVLFRALEQHLDMCRRHFVAERERVGLVEIAEHAVSKQGRAAVGTVVDGEVYLAVVAHLFHPRADMLLYLDWLVDLVGIDDAPMQIVDYGLVADFDMLGNEGLYLLPYPVVGHHIAKEFVDLGRGHYAAVVLSR